MKKFVVAVCALALMAGAVSCKKDPDDIDPIVEEDPVPEYAEGVYHPVMHLSTVAEDGAITEEYTWNGNDLASISYTDGSTVNYTYENGMISKINTNLEGMDMEVRYFYVGNQLTKCEVYAAAQKAIDMEMHHNELNKISGATLTVDQNFLLSLMGDLTGKSAFLNNVCGEAVTKAMVKMAQVAAKDVRKLTIDSQVIELSCDWVGENVVNQYVTAAINVKISSADLSLLGDAIPEELQAVLPLIDMMGGLPLTLALNDTITATYDEYYNPYFCNWGGLMSMDFTNPNLSGMLSLNNVLTTTNNGSMAISMDFMGQVMDFMNQPIANEYNEYSYLYNDKKYPTQKEAAEATITYSYKD